MLQLLIRISAFLLNVIKFATLLYLILILIAFATPRITAMHQITFFVDATNIEHRINQLPIKKIKDTIPYKYQGNDYSKLILFILALLFLRIVSFLDEALYNIANKIEYNAWRNKMDAQLPKEKVLEMDSKFQAIASAKKGDRKKLLREFAALKHTLDNMGQNLAFLAIDVVDSTGMKRDEDKHIAAFDFDRYNVIVSECLKKNGVVKFATTPDGVMSCFRTVDNAVKAASDLFEALVNFNKNEKQMKRDFEIRCGINAGFVYLDEETPLEQITDRVIDIAGHMQKHAKPDCINIAASAIEPLKLREGFNETSDVIDEQRVYEWNWKK